MRKGQIMPRERRLNFRYLATPEGLSRDRAVVVDEAGLILAIEPASGPGTERLRCPACRMRTATSSSARSRVVARRAAARIPSGAGARRCTGLPRAWMPRRCTLSPAMPMGKCLRPDSLPLPSFIICITAATVRAELKWPRPCWQRRARPASGCVSCRCFISAAASSPGCPGAGAIRARAGGGFSPSCWKPWRRRIRAWPSILCARLRPTALAPTLTAARDLLGDDIPVHIHIAEQRREVADCLAATGHGPVELLMRSVAVDEHWSLIHATHREPAELEALRAAGATVVVCPLTEACLGDGIFPGRDYFADDGRVAIGSDCNARIDAVEELRWLEYGQRLRRRGARTLCRFAEVWVCRCGGVRPPAARRARPAGRCDRDRLQGGFRRAGAGSGRLARSRAGNLARCVDRRRRAAATLAAVYVGGERLVEAGEWNGQVGDPPTVTWIGSKIAGRSMNAYTIHSPAGDPLPVVASIPHGGIPCRPAMPSAWRRMRCARCR